MPAANRENKPTPGLSCRRRGDIGRRQCGPGLRPSRVATPRKDRPTYLAAVQGLITLDLELPRNGLPWSGQVRMRRPGYLRAYLPFAFCTNHVAAPDEHPQAPFQSEVRGRPIQSAARKAEDATERARWSVRWHSSVLNRQVAPLIECIGAQSHGASAGRLHCRRAYEANVALGDVRDVSTGARSSPRQNAPACSRHGPSSWRRMDLQSRLSRSGGGMSANLRAEQRLSCGSRNRARMGVRIRVSP